MTKETNGAQDETAKRRDEVLKRMHATPPQPHKKTADKEAQPKKK